MLAKLEKPDFICVCEHWMKELVVTIPGYVVGDYFCRKYHRNGGVVIFVKKTIQLTNVPHTVQNLSLNSELEFEYAAVMFSVSVNDFILLSVYRSPTGCFNTFLGKLDSLIYTIINQASRPTVILTGDFNTDLLKDGHHQRHLLQMLHSYHMTPLITTPTRVSTSSKTLIDNVFTDYNAVNTSNLVFDPAPRSLSNILNIPC